MSALVLALEAYGLVSAVACALAVLAGCNVADRRAREARVHGAGS